MVAQGSPLPSRPRTLGDLLDEAVRRFGARAAIDFLGRKTRYVQLGKLTARAARGLQDLGVRPGARVALCLPNTPYYPILFFATLKAGGVVVNVNPLYVDRELKHLLEDSGAEVIIATDGFLMPQAALQFGGWQFERQAERDLLARLRAGGVPLGEWCEGRFYYGIKTGLNEAEHAALIFDPANADIIKPYLRGRDVKRWQVQSANK